jgi:hypothetical protein
MQKFLLGNKEAKIATRIQNGGKGMKLEMRNAKNIPAYCC